MDAAEYWKLLAKEMPEAQLQEQVRLIAVKTGWLYYHTHNSKHSPGGFPDCVMLRGKRLVFAELKRWDKFPTPAQMFWLEGLDETQRVEVYVWHPIDYLDGTIARILGPP